MKGVGAHWSRGSEAQGRSPAVDLQNWMEARAAASMPCSSVSHCFPVCRRESTINRRWLKSEKNIKWPASKERHIMPLENSLIDCPRALDTGDHKFNVKLENKWRRFLFLLLLLQVHLLRGSTQSWAQSELNFANIEKTEHWRQRREQRLSARVLR